MIKYAKESELNDSLFKATESDKSTHAPIYNAEGEIIERVPVFSYSKNFKGEFEIRTWDGDKLTVRDFEAHGQ